MRQQEGFRLGGLDGLRAIACIAVLFYHTWPTFLPGGFLGVDVFFVLSGFLITSILLRDLEVKERIDIFRFWLRRWRRLFPAVFLVVFVTVPIAAVLNIDLLARIRAQVLSALTFTYNWAAIASGSSYFDQGTPRFLTNMWTLSVEQQFYILWPLFVFGLWFFPKRIRVIVALTLALISVILMAYFVATGDDFSRAYMGTDSHSFGLMIGAAVAFTDGRVLNPDGKARVYLPRKVVAVATVAGLSLIGFCFYHVTDQSRLAYPWWTLVVVFSTAIVCLAMTAPYQSGSSSRAIQIMLDLPPLRWIGERSYGIYLWHWPFVVMWWDLQPQAPLWLGTLVVGGLSIIAAALSYKYVENPMRFDGIFATLKRWFTAVVMAFGKKASL